MGATLRRVAPPLGVALLLFAAAALGTGGRIRWCRTDPVVQIDGQTAAIVVSSVAAMNDAATGPTQVVVTVPPGVDAVLRADDPGFGHHGYDVRFVESDELGKTEHTIEVRIEAYVPASDDALRVRIAFTPRRRGPLSPASAEGTANAWVIVASGSEPADSDGRPDHPGGKPNHPGGKK